MKTALLVGLLLFCLYSSAQNFSGGLNTGGSYWIPMDADESFPDPGALCWDKGIFLRYESRKWFAVEGSFNQYALNDFEPFGYCGNGPVPVSQKINFRDYTLNLQSRLSKKEKKMQQFLGWSIVLGSSKTIIISQYGSEIYKYIYKSNYGCLGFSHFITYPIIPHFAISLRTSIQAASGSLPVYSDIALRIQGILGIAYRI